MGPWASSSILGVTIRAMRQRAFIAALLIAAAVTARPASGQEGVLINPGARSIGLGGAFAAIADDATAAFANPAGLVQILRPEISAEFRGTVSTSGIGAGLEGEAEASGLGFFSFVYPAQRWALALYSHQLASLDLTLVGVDPFTRELTVRSYSTAAALQISERLSVGAGLSYFNADRGPSTFTAGISDSDWGINAGLLWNAAANWKIAGFFRQGPAFETDAGADRSLLEFPSTYGVAGAFQPKGGGLTLGFEIDRVGGTVRPLPFGTTTTEGGTELHLGAEFAVLKWKPVVAFRAGVWQESGGERTRYLEPDDVSTTSTERVTHAAFGVGLAFHSFQIDLGTDFSDRAVIGSISVVSSF
jgi:long-chain fatty acid transport protein